MDMEHIAVNSSLVAIDSMNILLHIIGISILVYMYRQGDNKPNQIYLFNLSCAELIWSICCIANDSMDLLHWLGWTVDIKMYHAVEMAAHTGLMMNITCAMFFITGDRCQILYGMRYVAYCTRTKTFVLILVTWLFNVTTSVLFGMLIYFNPTPLLERIYDIVSMYVIPSMNIAYLLFAIICYSVVLRKLIKSRQRFHNSPSSSTTSSCSYISQILSQSKFSMSILIITSYFLFTVAPNATCAVWYFAFHRSPERSYVIFLHFYFISIRFSCTVDALIYIFLHPKIKEDLIGNVICCSHNTQPQMEPPSGVRRAGNKRRHEEMELVLIDEQN